jgi:riboflavin synthase
VTLDGVSLTTNDVQGTRFEANIIPHTRAVTTFGKLAAGSKVNVEVDLLARYLERLVAK